MQNADTPERALALLDRAVLLRLDPDPEVGMPFDAETGEPVVVGPNDANPELYWLILSELEQAYYDLEALGWMTPGCLTLRTACPVPHVAFASLETVLNWARQRPYADADLALTLDQLLDSRELGSVHHALASIVRRGASASCASIPHQKR